MSDFNIFITDSAAQKVFQIQKKENKKYLRISVDSGGCGGFQYNYDLENNLCEKDILITHGDITILIDEVSSEFLNNSTIEYIQELGSGYFNIKNPNANMKCGCGNSFSI